MKQPQTTGKDRDHENASRATQRKGLNSDQKWLSRVPFTQGVLRSRWWVAALMSAGISINFIDRQTFSVLEPVLHQQYQFTNTQYSIMVFCFLLGMAVMQLPIGALFDRVGVRLTFLLIVLGWSVANAAHAAARSLWQFSTLRFLLGNFECGSYSGGMKVISQWFPEEERALAGGIFNAGTLVGPVIAPPLVVWLTLRYSWRFAFLATSSLGLIWLLFWLRTYREPANPSALQPVVSGKLINGNLADGALASGQRIGFRELLRFRQAWGVMLIRAFSGPFSNFYWYWLPAYLFKRGLSFNLIGLVAWIPYLGGTLGNIGGGWLASRLLRHGLSLDLTRKVCFVLGGALAASSAVIPLLTSDSIAIAVICLSIFGSNVIEANYIGVVTDVFPQGVVGRLTGLTGLADNIMSMTLMLLTGIIVDRFSYFPIFIAVGIIPAVEILSLFLGVRRVERIEVLPLPY